MKCCRYDKIAIKAANDRVHFYIRLRKAALHACFEGAAPSDEKRARPFGIGGP